LFVHDRLRPHWSQAGAIVFITARTIDSIPRSVIQRWHCDKNEWLDRLEVRRRTPIRRGRPWHEVLDELPSLDRQRFYRFFNRQRELFLDNCHGACSLRIPELAEIVAASLMRFDSERYRMGDFVIMPNHVHLLAAFPEPTAIEKQVAS
jgi:putative transposase